jgi:hypothetical protein
MSSIQVRPATLRDAKAIAQIHTASALEAYRGLVPDDQLKAMSSVEKRQAYWREAIEYCEPQVQVAIDGDKIVGFVGFDRSRDEKSRQTTGEIWAIYAAPPTGTKALALPCGTPPETVCWKKAAPM